eukprot:4474752-Amphidinium_carterae.1
MGAFAPGDDPGEHITVDSRASLGATGVRQRSHEGAAILIDIIVPHARCKVVPNKVQSVVVRIRRAVPVCLLAVLLDKTV